MDILERLRRLNACDSGCEGRCLDCPNDVALDGAAEIERLREALGHALCAECNDYLGDGEIVTDDGRTVHKGCAASADEQDR